MTALYRVAQGLRFLHRRPSPDDLAWARARLTPTQQALFFAQQPSDQAHAAQVARTLWAQGHRDPCLLQAALLHDAGKAPGVSLPARTLVVLLKRLAPGWLARLRPDEPGWRAPLARAWHHPARGAALALAAGCDPATVALIEWHQSHAPPLDAALLPLLAALQAADDEN